MCELGMRAIAQCYKDKEVRRLFLPLSLTDLCTMAATHACCRQPALQQQ